MKEVLKSDTSWGRVQQENKNTHVLVCDVRSLVPLTEIEDRTDLGKDNELNFTHVIFRVPISHSGDLQLTIRFK